jgi:replicative DNA helicase
MADREFKMIDQWDPEKKERALLHLLSEVPPEASRAARKKRTERVPIQNYIQEALEIQKLAGTVQGLSTGFKGTDDLTLGMTPGELIILSGPPGSGKTQLATHWAYNNARAKHKSLFVTLEMTKPQITSRFMGASGTDLSELEISSVEYQKEDDLTSIDIPFLVSDAVRDKCELIIVDHLQFFAEEAKDDKWGAAANVVRELKIAARANEVPIILIVHVNKTKPGVRPTVSDMQGSALIHGHADQVLLVWRDNRPSATVYDANTVEITIWKNRLRGIHPGKRKATLYADGPKLSETAPIRSTDNPNLGLNFYEVEREDYPLEDPFENSAVEDT